MYEWHDSARDRDVPVKIYYPANAKGKLPVIIFSQGLGGSREGYEYLGRGWASEGYVSVHVQHKGSDNGILHSLRPMKAMRDAMKDPQNAINRPKDVSFAIDQLEIINRDTPPLQGRLDMSRIGVAGHSFGAYTALASAGTVFTLPGGNDITFGDKRIKAAIAMSAPVASKDSDYDKAYGGITMPVMHMTGTLDDSPMGETSAPERRIPYDHIAGADQYLIIFKGGDHMIFSGRGRLSDKGDKDAMFQKLILESSIKFWDAYLRGNAPAKQWLKTGGLLKALSGNATLEEK